MVQIGNDWDEVLEGEFEKEYYQNLRAFLAQEYKRATVYPDMYSIFNALKLTSYADTKIVILGQDPYHGPGQAHGLAFSVQKGIAIPPSLLNMYKELKNDLGCYIPDNGFLEKWAKQGVLLLNTSLTVRQGEANSHQKIGWQILTDTIIAHLNKKVAPVVYLLWGANARAKAARINNPMQKVLEAPHPSPLSASRGFFGCKHFSKANAFLAQNGLAPIDWQIENLQ